MLEVQDWGRIPYRAAWEKQKELLASRIADKIPDTVVFCEHNPAVITLGRGAQRDPKPIIVPPPGTDVIEIERGGLATWHGPGQFVAYPIVRLDKGRGFGVVALIRQMEAWIIETLKAWNLETGIVDGKTGVWIQGERKIASIGIAVSHWVSYHGLALNFATGTDPWRSFNPCGFDPEVMTDLRRETGLDLGYADVATEMKKRLSLLNHT